MACFHRIPTWSSFFVISILISGLSFYNSIFTIHAQSVGDYSVWEFGKKNAVDGYIKANVTLIENNTVFLDYLQYDLLGEFSFHLVNKTGGFLWKTLEDLDEAVDNGHPIENITILNQNVETIRLDLPYSGVTTKYYYSRENGMLVKSISDQGDYYIIISWVDINLVDYAKNQKLIPGYTNFLILMVLGISFTWILLLQKKNTLKKMNGKISSE